MSAPEGSFGQPTAPRQVSLLGASGRRADERAEPRVGVAVAGAGCALAVLGVLLVSGDTGAGDEGDFNNVPGILLSALVVAAGFALLTRFRDGPLATAGVVASATGIPPLLFFLTVDVNDLPPYSTEAILYVSTLAWFACWAVGPGKGRPFYLGAALVGFYLSVLQVVEGVFDAPFGIAEEVTADIGDTDVFDGTQQAAFAAPDPTTLGILSLLVGIGYLVIGRLLDKSGRHGSATPFTVVTLPALVTGVVLLFEDLELVGIGLLTIVLGAALAFHGATVGRRFTTWVGCGSVALGAALFLGDMSDDPTVLGMLFIAAGIALVAGGYAVAAVLDEPDELAPGASVFVRPERKISPPAAPSGWAPPLAGPPPGGGTTWGQPPLQAPPGSFGPPPSAQPSFEPPRDDPPRDEPPREEPPRDEPPPLPPPPPPPPH